MKHEQDGYVENYKTLRNEIREDQNKWKDNVFKESMIQHRDVNSP